MIKKIIYETMTNIFSNFKSFLIILLSFTLVFFISSFLWSYIANMKSINNMMRENFQVRLYISNNATEEEIHNLEKQILKYNYVKNLKFLSKDFSLQKLLTDFDLNIKSGYNPLPNAIVVSFYNRNDIISFTEETKKMQYIETIDAKERLVKSSADFIIALNKLTTYIRNILILPFILSIFLLMYLNIYLKKELIKTKSLLILENKYIIIPIIVEGFILILFSIITSTFLFFPVYSILRKDISYVLPNLPTLTTPQFLYSFLATETLIAGLIIILVSILLSNKYIESITVKNQIPKRWENK